MKLIRASSFILLFHLLGVRGANFAGKRYKNIISEIFARNLRIREAREIS